MISNIIRGIKQIKMRLQETLNVGRIKDVRAEEMFIYG